MTYHGQHWFLLLASREEMHRVWGRFDNERPGISTSQWIIVVSVVAIAFFAVMAWHALKRQSSRVFSSDSSTKLFRELCAAHGLTMVSRRLLKRLAEARGVTNPAMLFVDPKHFDMQGLPSELRTSAQELRRISEILFE